MGASIVLSVFCDSCASRLMSYTEADALSLLEEDGRLAGVLTDGSPVGLVTLDGARPVPLEKGGR